MGKKKAKPEEWPDRLRRLKRKLHASDDAEFAESLGVSTETLATWLSGRRQPTRQGARIIELLERAHSRRRPPREVGSRRVRKRKSEELDYWAYLELWREYLEGESVLFHRSVTPSSLLRLGKANVNRLPAARRKLGKNVTRFPLDRVASENQLDDDELTILAALVVAEIEGPEEKYGFGMRRNPSLSPTGSSLLTAVCESRGEIGKKSELLAPDGKLLASGLIGCMDEGKSLLKTTFCLTDSVRDELLTGLPKALLSGRFESELCSIIKPRVGFDDVVLCEKVRAGLEDALTYARHRKTLLDDWGFGDKIHYGRGLGLLFHGESGTGKTMAAQALARELNRDLWVVDFSRVVSMWVGQTEKHIVRVFRTAERAGAVLLIDEADALFASRQMAARSWEIRDVNVVLQEIERYEGVVVLTTNNRPVLDRALERRLAAVIEFPRPSKAEREAIWRLHVPAKAPLEKGIDFGLLAERDLTGGEIKKAVLAAAAAALKQGGSGVMITQDDLEVAANAAAGSAGVIGFTR